MHPLEPGDLVLEDATARYVVRVHRLRAGDRFIAFDPEARVEADVEIVSTGRSVRCRVEPLRAAPRVLRSGVTLLQSLGKGDKPEQVIRDATALGVERIVLVESRRAVVHLGDRADARRGRWRAVAVEAARQCGRGDVPEIAGPCPFDVAVALGSEPEQGVCRLCLVPDAALGIAQVVRDAPVGGLFAVLIGPEGGLDPDEVSRAIAHGFVPVALGGHVLRTETAAVVALGVITALVAEK
jgi:16S rRNA (uracil1498-N3)-methyltransferase